MRRELFSSRSEAQRAIEGGRVTVPSTTAPKASTLVTESEPIEISGPSEPFVSRAGRKLDAALDAFAIDVHGVRAIDVGASTGGFTDCLLQRSAESVTAVDVGYGQMHWRIRTDPRVTVVERTNIRHADPAALGAPFDLVVADVSFISLRTIAPSLERLGSEMANWVLLVKPQFEVGKDRVGTKGIVSEASDWADALRGVVAAYAEVGLGCQGVAVSSITGTTGNVEFLAHFNRAPAIVDGTAIEQHTIERLMGDEG